MKFEIYRDKAGEWRWRIRASNEKILADSGEGYDNEGDCVDAIALIRVNAKNAPLVFVSPTGAEEPLQVSRLDVTAVKLLLNDIGNDVTKLELTKKPAVYQHALECLAAHAQALVQLVTAPLARGTLEMPRLEGGGALPQAVPEAITADEPTAHQLPRQAQAGGDDFSEAPTLTGREA